jgi:hypothetical protein
VSGAGGPPPAPVRERDPKRHASGAAWSFPWHPFIATAAYLIAAYGATSIPVSWILRPLIIAFVVLAILLLLARLVLRSWQAAGLAVIGIWVAVAGWAWLLLIPAAVWVVARLVPRIRPPGLPALTRALNLVAIIWFAISLVGAVPAATRPALSIPPIAEVDPSATDERPDIYLLLLDGYARGDTLAAAGYDNEPFLAELEERGFEVYREATGRYETTAKVIASLVHGRDTDELLRARPPGETQQRYLRSLIEAAPLLGELRSLGYEVVTSAPTFGLVTLSAADVYLDDGQPTEFELSILSDTALATIVSTVAPTLLMELHASRIRSNFEHVEAIARADRGPTFMLAHVMSPHPPFVFDAAGDLPPPLACYPATCRFGQTREIGLAADDFWRLYADQMTYLNGLVLSAIDTILADPEAVIIVFSDHGSRRTEDDKAEWHRTLFAARTPGAPDIFGGASHAPAIIPVLMNAYFGADAPVLPPAPEPASD